MSAQAATPRFVTVREFMAQSSLGKSTVYDMIQRGDLPRPVRITSRRVAFPAEVVEAFFASKMEAAA